MPRKESFYKQKNIFYKHFYLLFHGLLRLLTRLLCPFILLSVLVHLHLSSVPRVFLCPVLSSTHLRFFSVFCFFIRLLRPTLTRLRLFPFHIPLPHPLRRVTNHCRNPICHLHHLPLPYLPLPLPYLPLLFPLVYPG